MQNPSNIHRPASGALPFNNLPGPLSPKEALALPGDNIFKRMYWASIMFMVALKAEARKQITGMVLLQNELEEEIEKEMIEHKKHHKRKGHIGRQDGGPGHEEGFDAGEIDPFYNGPELAEMYKTHEETKVIWIIRIIRIYYMSLSPIYNLLGLKRNEEGELSDEALDQWVVTNESNLEFLRLKMYLLNSLSEHSLVFDLKQVEFSDRFLNRLAATLCMDGQTLQHLQAVNPQALGMAVATAYSQQLSLLSAAANEMVQQTTHALTAAGVALKPAAPAPNPTPTALNNAVANMGPAQHPGEHAQQLSMERLGAVKTMFPNVPKPQNTQRREHAKQVSEKRAHGQSAGHALSKFNTNEAMRSELGEYANAIGVDPRVLEQAADHTRSKSLRLEGPEHAAQKAAKREMSAFPNEPAHAPAPSSQSLVGKLMGALRRPTPPASHGS